MNVVPEFKHPRRPKIQVKRKRPSVKCRQVERLYGPVELDILDNKQTGVRVVLLGDMHTNRTKCPPKTKCGALIWYYLDSLFANYQSLQPLDFFLEIPVLDQEQEVRMPPERATERKRDMITKNQPYRNYLSSLHVYFHNCFQRTKTACQFFGRPIRFHYSDVREGVWHSTTEFEDRVMIKMIRELGNVENTEVKLHHKNILNILLDKFINSDIKYFFRLTKIDKQLNRIKDEMSGGVDGREIKYQLNQMMMDHFTKGRDFARLAQSVLDEMIQTKLPIIQKTDENERAVYYLTKIIERPIPNMIKFTDLVWIVIGPLFSALLDIYTLSRMIRLEMKNIIIYAGMMHTQRIRWFLLNHLKFKRTASVASKKQGRDFQCVSLKGVPQPWFS